MFLCTINIYIGKPHFSLKFILEKPNPPLLPHYLTYHSIITDLMYIKRILLRQTSKKARKVLPRSVQIPAGNDNYACYCRFLAKIYLTGFPKPIRSVS